MREKFSIFVMLVLSVLIMLFLDAAAGFYLLAVIIISSAVSLFSALRCRKNITVSLSCSEGIVEKKDSARISIEIKKNTVLPLTFLRIKLFTDGMMFSDEPMVCRICPQFGKNGRISVSYKFTAKYCGRAEIGIESIVVEDFLGLISLPLHTDAPLYKRIKIFPDILDVSENDKLLSDIRSSALFTDSKESSSAPNSFAGIPGYDHRQYIPGDPMKKVNWKLSAKRDGMYVRMDETPSNLRQTVVAANMFSEDPEIRQLTMEAAVSFARKLMTDSIPCTFFIMQDGVWQSIKSDNESDIQRICEAVSDSSYCSGPCIPENEIKSLADSSVAVFTPEYNSILEYSINSLKNNGMSVYVISAVDSFYNSYIIKNKDNVLSFADKEGR